MGHFMTTISYFILLISSSALADGGLVGVNYGRIANDLPESTKVVELMKSQGINRAKLYDSNPTVVKVFADSGVKLVVALPNEILSSVAKTQSFADSWVQKNIAAYYPKTQIEAIAVGNKIFVDPANTTNFLMSAMKNIHST